MQAFAWATSATPALQPRSESGRPGCEAAACTLRAGTGSEATRGATGRRSAALIWKSCIQQPAGDGRRVHLATVGRKAAEVARLDHQASGRTLVPNATLRDIGYGTSTPGFTRWTEQSICRLSLRAGGMSEDAR